MPTRHRPPTAPTASLLLAAITLVLLASPAAAQLPPPNTQPPLTTYACQAGSRFTCASADGLTHRCCAAATSKCATFADGTARCAFCQRTCEGGPLAFHCQAGFTCGLGADGCATCIPDPTGNGSYVRPTPPPSSEPQPSPSPPAARPVSIAATGLGRQQPLMTATQQQPATGASPAQPGGAATNTGASAAGTGCPLSCGSNARCALVAPTAAAAKRGAKPAWRCVPRPRQAATGGRRMLMGQAAQAVGGS